MSYFYVQVEKIKRNTQVDILSINPFLQIQSAKKRGTTLSVFEECNTHTHTKRDSEIPDIRKERPRKREKREKRQKLKEQV